MLGRLYSKYVFEFRPRILGWFIRKLYNSKNINIAQGFSCDAAPRIIISRNSSLFIGKNVHMRGNVEIRGHEKSKIKIDKNVRIDRGVRLLSANGSNLFIGADTSIGLHSVFNGGDNIHIGNYCLISGFVYVQTSMHKHKKGEYIKKQGYDHSPITIDNDVWLGAHSVIMPGCEIAEGSIIGSNAVVTKSTKSNSIVAGVPAKLLKNRL